MRTKEIRQIQNNFVYFPLPLHLLSVRPVLSPGDAVMRIPAQMDLMAWGEIVNIARVFLARD